MASKTVSKKIKLLKAQDIYARVPMNVALRTYSTSTCKLEFLFNEIVNACPIHIMLGPSKEA